MDLTELMIFMNIMLIITHGKRCCVQVNNSLSVYLGAGTPPTPRHSHSAVVYEDSMYVFGGYDGHYRNDFYRFNFVTNSWSQINLKPNGNGVWPKSRYRTSTTVYKDMMFLFGGHDGARQLNDFYCFNFSKHQHYLKVIISY